jgi:hypothetical protein
VSAFTPEGHEILPGFVVKIVCPNKRLERKIQRQSIDGFPVYGLETICAARKSRKFWVIAGCRGSADPKQPYIVVFQEEKLSDR